MGNIVKFPREKRKRQTRPPSPAAMARSANERRMQDRSAAYFAITSLGEMTLDPAEAVTMLEDIDLDEIAPNLDAAVDWLLRFAQEWRRHADRKGKASLAAEGKHLRFVE